ncbi:MAG: CAP domain-containing protein [Kofleriaceae bacterium]
MRALLVVLVTSRVVVASPPETQALERVNQHRVAAGLTVVRVDPVLSKGCMEHARYMLLNKGTDAMVGLEAHKQRPDLPGATPAGAKCGKAADLFPGVSDLATAIDGWMAGIYHRRPMMDPGLKTIGIGYAALPDGSLMAALMFGESKDSTEWPVAYPAKDQKDVPLEYANEVPNPIPNNGTGGYPITLQFPPFDKVTGVRASLVEATKKSTKIPIHLSDPERPATSFGQYGVISVIPKKVLAPDRTYAVTIEATWKGARKTWSWSFTTLSLRRIDASDDVAMAGAIGVPSLVRGTVAYGGEMNTQTVFLKVGESTRGVYEMLSVLIPRAVWTEIAGTAEPASWKGATLEVSASPQLVKGKFMNLTIADASQLRVIARPPRPAARKRR